VVSFTRGDWASGPGEREVFEGVPGALTVPPARCFTAGSRKCRSALTTSLLGVTTCEVRGDAFEDRFNVELAAVVAARAFGPLDRFDPADLLDGCGANFVPLAAIAFCCFAAGLMTGFVAGFGAGFTESGFFTSGLSGFSGLFLRLARADPFDGSMPLLPVGV
jgi:hypothetical protein